ncbi:MAG: hypothetical protein IKI31_01700 [Treponema sp.]|nr:hypothetical protein [Treponema sp.]
MTTDEALEKFLHSFEQYYNVQKGSSCNDFVAEAEFHAHNEQYILVKAAKIADIDSSEYVFFAKENVLSSERLSELENAAWETGLLRVKPYAGHRNTDVTLVVLADSITPDAFLQVKKLHHYKSYKFGFHGWSSFRVLAYECSSGKAVTNRHGNNLRKLV